MSVNFTTPVGRLVQGDPYTAKQQTDDFGKPKVYPVGHAQAGHPVMQYFAAVAIPKSEPAWPAFREALMVEQRAAWPQFHDAAGNCTNPSFADKIVDGDGVNKKGQSYQDREGWPGHWIVKCASQFAPSAFEWDATLAAWKTTEPGKIKPGDYVRVSGTCQSNQSVQTAGMYMNLNMIALEREGDRIVFGPTAEQAFGAPGSGPVVQPAAPPAPSPATPPPPPAPAANPPAPAANPLAAAVADGWSPHPQATGFHYKGPDVVADAELAARYAAPAAPPAPGVPPPPPAPSYPITEKAAGPVMLPAANGVSYTDFIAKGWTDAQLVVAGMMAA